MELRLGKQTQYLDKYDNSLLDPIPRKLTRDTIGLDKIDQFFTGVDIWNCYEFSRLNLNGKPEVRILRFYVPCESEYILESKSVKLYLNSFTNSKFSSDEEIISIIRADFSKAVKFDVLAELYKLDSLRNERLTLFKAHSLDELDVTVDKYEVDADLIKLSAENIEVEEELSSNLLKSNCLVTGQPDWASVYIKYKGQKIDHASLLKYLISFRNHNEFHEQCVERIFSDVMRKCAPTELTVHAKYTRRGGIDINPYRSNMRYKIQEICKSRDVRQ